jgi:hypothetical protein
MSAAVAATATDAEADDLPRAPRVGRAAEARREHEAGPAARLSRIVPTRRCSPSRRCVGHAQRDAMTPSATIPIGTLT